MKLNIDFTDLNIAREQMESLYRSPQEAKRAGVRAKQEYGMGYNIEETMRSVAGAPPRQFWKVVYQS